MVGTCPGDAVAETDTTQVRLGPADARAESRPRIAIVIPVFQAVYPTPFANFLQLAMRTAHTLGGKYGFDILVPERQLLHGAMNTAIEKALAGGYAALILADDDCFAPPDAIQKLVHHYEQGVEFVAGVGFMRNFPHTTTVGSYYKEGPTVVEKEDGTFEWTGFKWWDDISTMAPLQEVDFCGFPIALISQSAMKKIQPPWFGTHILGGDCTHDVYFARKAQDAGVKIYVDSTIRCGHLSPSPTITFGNRDLVRKVAQMKPDQT